MPTFRSLLLPRFIPAYRERVLAFVARHGSPWWQTIPFVLLTTLLVGVPVFVLLLLGKLAKVILPRMRDWIDTNSWIANEIVIGFFLVMTISGLEHG